MQRVLETHTFGVHTVAVLEEVEDEGLSYSVLVDGHPVTEPIGAPPSFEDVVRSYARARPSARHRHPAAGAPDGH